MFPVSLHFFENTDAFEGTCPSLGLPFVFLSLVIQLSSQGSSLFTQVSVNIFSCLQKPNVLLGNSSAENPCGLAVASVSSSRQNQANSDIDAQKGGLLSGLGDSQGLGEKLPDVHSFCND